MNFLYSFSAKCVNGETYETSEESTNTSSLRKGRMPFSELSSSDSSLKIESPVKTSPRKERQSRSATPKSAKLDRNKVTENVDQSSQNTSQETSQSSPKSSVMTKRLDKKIESESAIQSHPTTPQSSSTSKSPTRHKSARTPPINVDETSSKISDSVSTGSSDTPASRRKSHSLTPKSSPADSSKKISSPFSKVSSPKTSMVTSKKTKEPANQICTNRRTSENEKTNGSLKPIEISCKSSTLGSLKKSPKSESPKGAELIGRALSPKMLLTVAPSGDISFAGKKYFFCCFMIVIIYQNFSQCS